MKRSEGSVSLLRSKTALFGAIVASIYAAFLVGLFVFNYAVIPTNEGMATFFGYLIVAQIENWILIYHLCAVIFAIFFLWHAYSTNNNVLTLLSTIAFGVAAFLSLREYIMFVSIVLASLSVVCFFTIDRAKTLNAERQRHKEERDQLRREREIERRAVQRFAAAGGKAVPARLVSASVDDFSLEELELDVPGKPSKPSKGVPYPLRIALYTLSALLAAAAVILWGPAAFHAFFAWLDSILVALSG